MKKYGLGIIRNLYRKDLKGQDLGGFKQSIQKTCGLIKAMTYE
jgi:hypothetical protein